MVAPQNLPQGVAPGPPMREKEKERRSQQPQRFVSPMELAPSNIFSEKSSYVDPVVQQIVAALEKNAEAIKDAELEVELRLGLLFPMGSGERLDLPCKGETMLKHCPQFHYRFAPGLPVDAFVTLSRRIEDMCSERQPRDQSGVCGLWFLGAFPVPYVLDNASACDCALVGVSTCAWLRACAPGRTCAHGRVNGCPCHCVYVVRDRVHVCVFSLCHFA